MRGSSHTTVRGFTRDAQMTLYAFRDAQMTSCVFRAAQMTSCVFRDAQMTSCVFRDAQMTSYVFRDAPMTSCLFSDVRTPSQSSRVRGAPHSRVRGALSHAFRTQVPNCTFLVTPRFWSWLKRGGKTYGPTVTFGRNVRKVCKFCMTETSTKNN